MRILVTGAGGYIGSNLVQRLEFAGHHVTGTTRETLDLLEPGNLGRFVDISALYLCAGKTRFIDCESDPTAYRVNVDAQIGLARHFSSQKIPCHVVFLSSDSVERGLHTLYGLHKALAETGLLSVCKPVIARICQKVTKDNLAPLLYWLVRCLGFQPGVYRWP